MNSEQLMGVFRAIIPGIVAALAHWGIGTDAMDTAIATAVATAIVAGWSSWSNSNKQLISQVNSASVPGVKVVASTSPSPQVNEAP